MFEPVIKWSGSKRSQCEEILKHIPQYIDAYYEPFIGGGSVTRALLTSRRHSIDRFYCSDLNSDLINLWNEIKNNPSTVSEHYKKLWTEMNNLSDQAEKKRYFENVRSRYNSEHNPLDFMFIMRTTTNGMPRYNRNGQFNNSFHITRNGIEPERLDDIIHEWSNLLYQNNVVFTAHSYEEINPGENDFIYMDPPYANTKGMYFGNFDTKKFFEWLREIKCPWILSYDGKSGEIDNTYEVPKDLYDEHIYIKSGNSSFKRTIGKDKNAMVYESLYIKK